MLLARGVALSRCERCAAWREASYHPDPLHGRGIWLRCFGCGAARLLLCQMRGSREIFSPPVTWLESDALDAAHEARQVERWIAAEQEAERAP